MPNMELQGHYALPSLRPRFLVTFLNLFCSKIRIELEVLNTQLCVPLSYATSNIYFDKMTQDSSLLYDDSLQLFFCFQGKRSIFFVAEECDCSDHSIKGVVALFKEWFMLANMYLGVYSLFLISHFEGNDQNLMLLVTLSKGVPE